MASLTVSVTEDLKGEIKELSWVNWSEIAREEALKKVILDNYMEKGSITDEEWEFCDKVDWHPVDELPLKEEFRKELNERRKGPFIRIKRIEDLFK